jgi:hypothetical protein
MSEPTTPENNSTVDPDGRSLTYYRSLAYEFPNQTSSHVEPFLNWFKSVNESTIDLTDGARSFELEVLLHQFETQISSLLDLPLPEPIVYKEYEKPTKLAYDTRKKELIAAGKYNEPTEIDPENPMPELPIEIYIDEIPSIKDLTPEQLIEVKTLMNEWYNGFKSSQLVKTTIENLTMCRELLHQLGSDDTWELVRESNGLKTFYRSEKDVATHSFKVVGEVQAETIALFSLIYEVTQFSRWFPFMRSGKQLTETSRYKKVCQAIIAAVWPMSDRECLLDCGGVDDSSRGRVLINMKDLSKDHHDYYEPPSKYVRCFMSFGGFMLKPISLNRTQVSFYTNVDPQVSLPTSLLNMVTGKMIHTLLPTMEQWAPKTKDPEGEWAKERAKRELVYNDVQTKIERFFQDEIEAEKRAKEEIDQQ